MRIVIDYRIRDEVGSVFTRASTTQVPVDATTLELLLGSPDFFVNNVRSRMKDAGLLKE
jgi:acyl-CoA thioesterase FadM